MEEHRAAQAVLVVLGAADPQLEDADHADRACGRRARDDVERT